MSERSHEELSALMDGEASELELRRIISGVDEDTELLRKWRRYHVVRSVMQGDMRESQAAEYTRLDISAAVSSALAAEPAHDVKDTRPDSSWQERFLRPLSSVAVAASVSAMVVFGWQNFSGTQDSNITAPGSSNAALAQVVVPANNPDSGYQTVSDSQRRIQRNVVNQADIVRLPSAQNQRLNQYLVSHSGNAALNTASGSMSYTRVVHIAP